MLLVVAAKIGAKVSLRFSLFLDTKASPKAFRQIESNSREMDWAGVTRGSLFTRPPRSARRDSILSKERFIKLYSIDMRLLSIFYIKILTLSSGRSLCCSGVKRVSPSSV